MVPVSSSAQLVVLPWLLGWDPPPDRTTFAAALHAGSCLGIAWTLRSDLRALDRRTAVLLAGSCVPAALAGALAADRVEARLGRPPQLAALLAGAGMLLWAVDRRAEPSAAEPTAPHRMIIRTLTSDPPGGSDGNSPMIFGVGPREAALAALAQVAALAPGVSRAGATLTVLRAVGVDRIAAQRFSLLMSLPVTAGAAALTLARSDRATLCPLALALSTGATTAALAGAAAARAQQRHPGRSAAGPALYRLGLAAAIAQRLHRTRKDPP